MKFNKRGIKFKAGNIIKIIVRLPAPKPRMPTNIKVQTFRVPVSIS